MKQIAVIVLCLIFMSVKAGNGPEISMDSVDVVVSLKGAERFVDSEISASIEVTPLFTGTWVYVEYPMQRQGNSLRFEGLIPLELTREMVNVCITIDNVPFYSQTRLVQGKVNELELAYDNENQHFSIVDNSTLRLSPQQLNAVFELFDKYDKLAFLPLTKHLNSAEEGLRFIELVWKEKYLPQIDSLNIDSTEYPAVVNNLKWRFLARHYAAISRKAEDYGIKGLNCPFSEYSFLNSIDYSPLLLNNLNFSGMRPLIYNLLRFPDGGFEKIGDTQVQQWQSEANAKLSTAIDNPTQLLLDLMAGMSYMAQLENLQPLSSVQVKNVEQAFATNDIGKIILKTNDALVADLNRKHDFRDLSKQSFDLKHYIDSAYTGRPVVVDLWNTWCGPCLQSIAMTERLREGLDTGDIQFVYISDTSSDYAEMRRRMLTMNGATLFISEEESLKTGEAYNLTGLPSGLFFDRDHQLIETITGIPSETEYLALIRRLQN